MERSIFFEVKTVPEFHIGKIGKALIYFFALSWWLNSRKSWRGEALGLGSGGDPKDLWGLIPNVKKNYSVFLTHLSGNVGLKWNCNRHTLVFQLFLTLL